MKIKNYIYIFKKDMAFKKYFSSKDLAILSSKKGNTLKDIEKFIRKQEMYELGDMYLKEGIRSTNLINKSFNFLKRKKKLENYYRIKKYLSI